MRVSNQMGGNRLYKSTKAAKEKKIAAQARKESMDSFINSSKSMGLAAIRYNDEVSGLSFKQRHDNLRQLRINYRKASQLMKLEKYKPLTGEKDVWTSLINGKIGEKELDEALVKLKEEEQKKENAAGTEEKKEETEKTETAENKENTTEAK